LFDCNLVDRQLLLIVEAVAVNGGATSKQIGIGTYSDNETRIERAGSRNRDRVDQRAI
jgi:hypothetical protein